MFSVYVASADFERRYNDSNQSHDVSPVVLSEFQESVGSPGHSSVFQFDDVDDDDAAAAEDGDSKEEVCYSYVISYIITL